MIIECLRDNKKSSTKKVPAKLKQHDFKKNNSPVFLLSIRLFEINTSNQNC